MQTATTHSEVNRQELELWTLEDAETWKEAEFFAETEVWMDEDPLLDNDLWMDGEGGAELTLEGLNRLGIRVS